MLTITHPKRQFSVKRGTFFENSPLGLDKWLPAVWPTSTHKNGFSSYEIARDLGVTQKTAWFMLQGIRLGLQSIDAEPETLWSVLRRGLNRTYVSAKPFHQFRYLDEQMFRYNHRKDDTGKPMNDAQRFDLAVRQSVGKRRTWNALTGKEIPGRPKALRTANQAAGLRGRGGGLNLRFCPRVPGVTFRPAKRFQ